MIRKKSSWKKFEKENKNKKQKDKQIGKEKKIKRKNMRSVSDQPNWFDQIKKKNTVFLIFWKINKWSKNKKFLKKSKSFNKWRLKTFENDLHTQNNKITIKISIKYKWWKERKQTWLIWFSLILSFFLSILFYFIFLYFFIFYFVFIGCFVDWLVNLFVLKIEGFITQNNNRKKMEKNEEKIGKKKNKK